VLLICTYFIYQHPHTLYTNINGVCLFTSSHITHVWSLYVCVCIYIYACNYQKNNVALLLSKFRSLGMIYACGWTKEIFLFILSSVRLYNWAPTGLHQSVCPYELVNNCDLCGNANGTHVMYSTGEKTWAERTFKTQGGMGWGRGNTCYRFAVCFQVETFLKGQTGRKDRVTEVNCETMFMTVLFIASMDGPSVYV